ncbi:MAG: site-specific integrase [Clostridium sp.]|nr:site-specific integrase [Clostridium sp.]MDY3813514.1 tyrosine-type recombinase/integrase [Candidatus Copromonas sp.]
MRKHALPVNLLPDRSRQTLTDFERWLLRNGKAFQTIRSYLYAARQFLSLYSEASHHNLMLYKCYLIDRYKPRTVNLRIRAINCFMEFLGIPTSRVLMVRLQQKPFLENVISQADYEYLKKCLLRDGKISYYFAVRIMAATGVRISELIQIRVEDIRRGQCDLYSKGNKIRRIYFPHSVQEPCLLWLQSEGRNTGCLFLNRLGEPITISGIRDQLRVFAFRYHLDPAVIHPHSFRHLFAKNFVERCDDIALLSDILGHESIETTRIYLHKSSTEQQALFNQIVIW